MLLLSICLIACSLTQIEENLVPSAQYYVSNTDLQNFYGNAQYGDNNIEVFDAFIPSSGIATGAVINFHGGGFISGDKDGTYSNSDEVLFIEDLLANDIAFFNVNYTLIDSNIDEEGVIKSLESARGVVQEILYNASFFNIDVSKIILRGSSAGSGIAMYLGYGQTSFSGNPNPVDNININPIAVCLNSPQATYDLLEWDNVLSFYGYSLSLDYDTNSPSQQNLHRFYAIDDFSELTSTSIINYRQSVDMLKMIDDFGGVPTWLNSPSIPETQLTSNTLLDLLHNSYHGLAIRNALLAEGEECKGDVKGLYTDPTGESELNFIKRYL